MPTTSSVASVPLTSRKTIRYRVWNSETRTKSKWFNTVVEAQVYHSEFGGVIQKVEMGSPIRITIINPDP